MAGTYFNKRRKLGILDKDLGSSDVISVFTCTTEHITQSFYSAAFCQLVEKLF